MWYKEVRSLYCSGQKDAALSVGSGIVLPGHMSKRDCLASDVRGGVRGVAANFVITGYSDYW